jgi:hypothetical protein
VKVEQLLNVQGIADNIDRVDSAEALEKLTEDTKNAILKTSAQLATDHRKSSHLKPYWTSQLTALSKEQKAAWRAWVEAGRPRDQANEVLARYKAAKRTFRRKQREADNEYHIKQIEQLCKQSEIDQKGFWYIVNKFRKPKQSRVTPVKGSNGHMLTDPVDVAEDWRKYYEQIFQSAGLGEGYDDQFYEEVMNSMKTMLDESFRRPDSITQNRITEDEVAEIIKTLKNRKAPGEDEICNEHLKYMVL